jgi:FtsH-binding integral membrane protein
MADSKESISSDSFLEKAAKFGEEYTVMKATVAERLAFLRKVYGILFCQIALSAVIGAVCMCVPAVKDFVQNNNWFVAVATVLTFVMLIGLFIFRYQEPLNYFLLAAFTFFEGINIGTALTYFESWLVIKAFVITVLLMFLLTCYTSQSTYDYSTWGASLFAFLWILIGMGILQIFFWSEPLDLVMSVGGALLFCGFIVFDTHMLMRKLPPSEYILASINLYLDLVNLFLYILRILQSRKN